MDPLTEILKLDDGENWIWPESDYGKAEIWFIHETYFLFEIPNFGGTPRFDSSYKKDQLQDLIDHVNSQT